MPNTCLLFRIGSFVLRSNHSRTLLLPRKLADTIPKSPLKELTVSQKQREKLIASFRKLRAKGFTFSAIVRQLDMDSRTVKRYMDPTIDCLEDQQNRVYTRGLDDCAKYLPDSLLRHQKSG